MKKSVLKVTLVLILVISSLLFPINATAFNTNPAIWAKEAAINSLFYEIAYSSFFKDFDRPITREEFAMIAVNVYRIASGRELEKPSKYTFLDIFSSQYKDEIQIAKNLGIVLGTNSSHTLFSPARLVTRQEICKMIFRLLKIIDPSYDYENIERNDFFDRSQIASWAINEVDFAYNEGIMNGTSTSKLVISPTGISTREQGLTLVFRMMKNWKYIVPVSQKLLDEMNFYQNAINIGSQDYLEDYLRDSVKNKKRDIRIVLSDGLTKADIETKLLMIIQEFEDIGYYYVPEVGSYEINLLSPIYVISMEYIDNENIFPSSLICKIDNWDEFDEYLLLQVRSGIRQAAFDISDTSMRNTTEISSRIGNILYTHPELNYVRTYKLSLGSSVSGRYTVEFEFAYSAEDTVEYLTQIKDFSDDFIYNYIKPGMTAIEKEIAIHNYIVSNTSYYTGTESVEHVFYENGVFFYNEAVCQGYASAVKLLLSKSGIYSLGIYGMGNGFPHAWNLIKLYGRYYHLDVTWDDPIPDESGRLRYDYFNVSQAEILRNHTINMTITYPVADGILYNYYSYINALFSTEEGIVSYIKDKISNDVLIFSFKVSNYSSIADDIPDLIKQAHLALGISTYKYSYSENPDMGVINVNLTN